MPMVSKPKIAFKLLAENEAAKLRANDTVGAESDSKQGEILLYMTHKNDSHDYIFLVHNNVWFIIFSKFRF